jgi:sulfoxide reductase heme-binding subunit YedZ
VIAAALSPAWDTARAAGLTALVLSGLTVATGTLFAARWLTGGGRAAVLRAVHEGVALATLVAVAAHGIALAADPWLKASLSQVLVPFTSPYRPAAVALGQIAAYGFLLLGPTYYVRKRLGAAGWKRAHRFVALFWGLAVVHALTAGTDASTAWFLASTLPVLVAAGGLVAGRYAGVSTTAAGPGSARPRSSGSSPATRARSASFAPPSTDR